MGSALGGALEAEEWELWTSGQMEAAFFETGEVASATGDTETGRPRATTT